MGRSRIWALAIAFAAVLSQSGCTVSSKDRLVDIDKAPLDEKILGHWRIPDNNQPLFGPRKNTETEVAHWFVGRPPESAIRGAPKNVGIAHGVHFGTDHKLDCLACVFLTSKIGMAHYLDVIPYDHRLEGVDWTAVGGQPHWFFKYELQDDRLTLWTPDVGAIIKLVEDGKLKGEITRGFAKSVRLSESAESWSRFLQTDEGMALFKDSGKLVLERVK
jgi:hypothetical protein